MSYSSLSQAIAPFLAMEVMERGMEMSRSGIEVLQLGVGEPGFPPPPEVTAAVGTAVAPIRILTRDRWLIKIFP